MVYFFETIFIGLFGKSTTDTFVPFIRHDAKNALVSLEFELNSQIIKIKRVFEMDDNTDCSVNIGSSVHINNKLHADGNIQTNNAIYSLINMDEELYNNWIYIRKNESNEVRRKIINDLVWSNEINEEGHKINIDVINLHLNKIFSMVNPGDTNHYLELDTDYNLLLYEKDVASDKLKPLSNADRVIFNTMLRCALLELLSTDAHWTLSSSALPPLIVDGAFMYLPKNRIEEFVKLIDIIKNSGSDQVMVVSSGDSSDILLNDPADLVLDVVMDPMTLLSQVFYQ
ncbi:MAG: hypothetical protein K8R25_08420 [Methanosarcinales archaeon]|nr:hypothetical protein [Methanosarcinales archaeon]